MLAGKRFVIWGLSRLTVQVARVLSGRQAEVVLVRNPADKSESLLALLGDEVRIQNMERDLETALREADLPSASCLLTLSDDDLTNVQAAVTAFALAPQVPVVVRAFDPVLADELEEGMNIRRAFSQSALAGPAFVAAALGGEVLETLRLGTAEVPLCRLVLQPGSPLIGSSTRALKQQYHCGVLALATPGGAWRRAAPDDPLEAGGQVVVGGLLKDVLLLAKINSRLFETKRRPSKRSRGPRRAMRLVRSVTLLPLVALALSGVLAVAVAVLALTRDLDLADALALTLNVAWGQIETDRQVPAWMKYFECGVLLAGGALLAVVFSYLASVATTERLEQRMGQRAQRMAGHMVVAGLGNTGFRVQRLLTDLGIPTVVLEAAPSPRFAEVVRERAVLLTGDVRLPEALERAAVADAVAILACTDNDLANLQACVHARRLNPAIRTVVRIFDDHLAQRLPGAFRFDAALSPAHLSADVFVGAATDERATRTFTLDGQDYLAFRYELTAPLPLERIEAWRTEGLRFLAFRQQTGPARPSSQLTIALVPGDAIIVAGPEAVVHKFLREP